jgi:O-antigen ligase
MLRQSNRISFTSNGVLFQIIAACCLGSLLGVVSGMFSGLLALGVVASLFFVYASIKRPEIALLLILITTATIVYEEQLPTISLGISLHIPDILLLGLLVLIVVRWLFDPGFKIVHTPLDLPLLIFYAVTLLSTFVALYNSSVEVEVARRAIRVLLYYLTFFVVTNLVRERRQLIFLLNGIFILANIVAAVMVAQYFLGRAVTLLPGRIEALDTNGLAFEDVTRILPPGLSIVLVVFVVTFCTLVLDRFTSLGWLNILQLGFLGIAFLFTFLRSYIGALAFALFLLVFILKGPDRQKLINWSLVILIVGGMFLVFLSAIPDSGATGLVEASSQRLGTIFKIETYQGQDGSLNWRAIENGYAIRQIIAHPWLGLGMDAVYRPFDSRLDTRTVNMRNFIHNGHLKIMLNSGLIGYFSFMWLSFVFLRQGFKGWRDIHEDRFRGIVLSFTLVFVAITIAALVNTTFTQWRWTPVIGIMMGINEVILLKFKQAEAVV